MAKAGTMHPGAHSGATFAFDQAADLVAKYRPAMIWCLSCGRFSMTMVHREVKNEPFPFCPDCFANEMSAKTARRRVRAVCSNPVRKDA